eukprot:gene8534-11534_t
MQKFAFMFVASLVLAVALKQDSFHSVPVALNKQMKIIQKVIPIGAIAISITNILNPTKVSANSKIMDGKLEYMPALQGLDYGKPRTYYPDYTQKESGLQYKVVTEGKGPIARKGDRVTVDWEGYTIGYYGRPFQTRNKVQGGAFDSKETDYFRWIVGSGNAVAAIDEAVQYLNEGTIAQIIVPVELGYPKSGDSEHVIVGPKPDTFSGLRALNFVLDNQNMIDKTLLINIKIVKVDKTGGRGVKI